MRVFCSIFLILVLWTGLYAPVQAQQSSSNNNAQSAEASEPERYVRIRILPERGAVEGGNAIWIGIEQSIYPGWHTYWQNPGDSGAAPRFAWDLPEGFEIGEIQWPVPKKLPYGDLLNYGYENNVILLQKLEVPDVLGEGPISLKLDTEILVCKDICIPEFGTYELVLNGPDNLEEDNSAYLEAARGRLPASLSETAKLSRNGEFLELELSSYAWCDAGDSGCRNVELFPKEWGLVQNTADSVSEIQDDALVIRQKASEERNWRDLEKPAFVLAYTDIDGNRIGVSVESALVHEIMALLPSANLSGVDQSSGVIGHVGQILGYAFLALLGGIVLNLMPCVFPVLSMKALSLAKTAGEEPAHARLHGMVYTAGVVLSFLLIAGILIGFKAAGAQIGWGFQLQNPVVVTLLAYLIFVIGLNLMGFFEVGGSFMSFGSGLVQKQGLSGSFFTGVLATLVATPCTAPFMAAAIGFALAQPAAVSLFVFAALGFGLALPYLVLSFIPALQRILPKPGPWMDVFKQFLAFPMFLTAAWLIWVLGQQSGAMGVFGALLGMTGIAFALWLLKVAPNEGRARFPVLALAFLSGLSAFGFLPMSGVSTSQPASQSVQSAESAFGEVFSQSKLDALLQGDKPVFVEMTAAWCITCKVNHATSLNISSTKQVFAENNVEYLIGDWTNYDPVITQYLESFGRNGVPIYVFYGPRDPETKERPAPQILPQILTPGIVKGAVQG